MASAPTDSQATLSLVLGIIGLFCCGILAPIALFIGNGARKRIQASGGTLGGEGLATAGFILGIIGTVVWALAVLIYLLVFVAAINRTG